MVIIFVIISEYALLAEPYDDEQPLPPKIVDFGNVTPLTQGQGGRKISPIYDFGKKKKKKKIN